MDIKARDKASIWFHLVVEAMAELEQKAINENDNFKERNFFCTDTVFSV